MPSASAVAGGGAQATASTGSSGEPTPVAVVDNVWNGFFAGGDEPASKDPDSEESGTQAGATGDLPL